MSSIVQMMPAVRIVPGATVTGSFPFVIAFVPLRADNNDLADSTQSCWHPNRLLFSVETNIGVNSSRSADDNDLADFIQRFQHFDEVLKGFFTLSCLMLVGALIALAW